MLLGIEGVNIEYGKIENCNIDTNLMSKMNLKIKFYKVTLCQLSFDLLKAIAYGDRGK